MELYGSVSYDVSKRFTTAYSTSFSLSSRLFASKFRPHIYAIYGFVRIADEIVDSYSGDAKADLLDELEKELTKAITRGYSSNPIVHAFAATASQYGISTDLTKPFFDSMRMDIEPKNYHDDLYHEYIFGSAEVVGLMCLRVFSEGDNEEYASLEGGARMLGSAYQKVNFLRDMAADYHQLGRVYFPGIDAEHFSAREKRHIVDDIKADFAAAEPALEHLPRGVKTAVMTSYQYYLRLLELLEAATPAEIMEDRISVPSWQKLWLMVRTIATSWRPW